MSEWNGEGIPPVGTVCEATWGTKVKWCRAVILEYGHGVASFAYRGDDAWRIAIGTENAEFRPLQSEEQRQVAEIDAIITSHDNTASPEIAQEIYNAGFRKVEQ